MIIDGLSMMSSFFFRLSFRARWAVSGASARARNDKRKGKPIGDGTRFAHELPRSEFAVLARTGHDAPEESPDQVNRLVLAYLKEGLSRIPENVAWSSPSSHSWYSSNR